MEQELDEPTEIVLVGYDNGTVKLLSKSVKNVENESPKVIQIPPDTVAAYKKYAFAIPERTPDKMDQSTLDAGKLRPGRRKHIEGFMQCDMCPYNTMKKRLMIQHMSVSHMTKDRQCPLCGKLLNKWQLKLHMRFHDLKFVCDMCGKRFGDSKALRNHKNSRVCGQKYLDGLKYKNFKCEYCDYRTHTNKLLMVHFRTIHVPKDQSCPNCGKLMTAKQLQSHKNFCNRGKFSCQLCSKVFSHPKYLNLHIKSKHVVKEEYTEYVIHELPNEEATEVHESYEELSQEGIDWDAVIQQIDEPIEEQIDEPMEEQIEEPIIDNNLVKMEKLSEDEMNMTVEMLQDEYAMEEVAENEYHYEMYVQKEELEDYEEEQHLYESQFEPKLENIKFEIKQDGNTENLGELIDEKPVLNVNSCYICHTCQFETVSKQILIQHFANVHVEHDIQCPTCDKMLSQKNYYRHMRQHNKNHMCDQCGKRFTDPGILRQHVEKQKCQELTLEDMQKDPAYMAKPYSCTLCLYRGDHEKNLKRHIRYMHRETPKDKTCPDCGKQMTSIQYRSHRKSHIKVQCPICNKWLTDGKFFRVHMSNHSRTDEPKSRVFPYPEQDSLTGVYKCMEGNCTYETATKRFLAQHWQHIHAPKDQICPFPECQGKIMSIRQLKHHMRGHEKKFKCEICEIGFPDRRDLKRHLDKRRCKPPKQIVEDMWLSDAELGDLSSHSADVFIPNESSAQENLETINTNIEKTCELDIKLEDPIEVENQKKSNVKSETASEETVHNPTLSIEPNEAGIYECPSCNYETIKKRLLSQHWLHLHGPKNVPCPYPECKGKLMTKLQFKIHKKFHEPKFECENCGNQFNDKSKLRNHVVTFCRRPELPVIKEDVIIQKPKLGKSQVENHTKNIKKEMTSRQHQPQTKEHSLRHFNVDDSSSNESEYEMFASDPITNTPTKSKDNSTEKKQFLTNLKLKKEKEIFACDVCQNSFSSLTTLKKHKCKHTIADPLLNEQQSSLQSPDKTVTETEASSSHKTTSFLKCSDCNFKSLSMKLLKQHASIVHAIKDQKCPECDKSFSKEQLRRHMYSHQKKFKCEKCRKGFTDSRDLNRHLNKCNQISSEIILEKSTEEGEENVENSKVIESTDDVFACDMCDYKNAKRRNYLKHLKTHQISTDQVCPICQKLFDKSQMKYHMRIHNKNIK